ncbi:hypothetical protein F9K79_10055 [Ochrobactrum sp. Kaboul]|nr:hypothetical protein F9K79_10055 [Ochrobactrum sp. Kaboul]
MIQKTPCRAANGNFCASGAHVPLCTLRSGSRNHHFGHGLPLFDANTATQALLAWRLRHMSAAFW